MSDTFNINIYSFSRELYINYILSLINSYKKKVISLLNFQYTETSSWVSDYSDFVNNKVKYLLVSEFIFDSVEGENKEIKVLSGSEFSFGEYSMIEVLSLETTDLQTFFKKVESKLGKGFETIYMGLVKSIFSA
jgi:hypothetical protein